MHICVLDRYRIFVLLNYKVHLCIEAFVRANAYTQCTLNVHRAVRVASGRQDQQIYTQTHFNA